MFLIRSIFLIGVLVPKKIYMKTGFHSFSMRNEELWNLYELQRKSSLFCKELMVKRRQTSVYNQGSNPNSLLLFCSLVVGCFHKARKVGCNKISLNKARSHKISIPCIGSHCQSFEAIECYQTVAVFACFW